MITSSERKSQGNNMSPIICRKGPAAAVQCSSHRYELWHGKKVSHPQGDMVFISTPENLIKRRMEIYQEHCRKNPKTECPYPMPEGHVMFLDCGNNFYRKVV